MRATLSQIETFFWISELGSFRAAALQLNLTQPTISLRIQNLEETLGVRLFQRVGRRMGLTDAGTALLPDVRRLINLARNLNAQHNPSDPLRGRLRLGAPASVALSCMQDLLDALKKRNAQFDLALTTDRSSILQQKLNERELDVAIIVEPEVQPHVRIIPLGMMNHVWVASSKLRLPKRWIEPRDLVSYEIFTQPNPSTLMMLVLSWFGSAGLEPGRLNTCDSLTLIARFVAAGECIAVLPPAILPVEVKSGAVRILKTRPPLVRPALYLAYQVDKSGHAMEQVIEATRHVIARSRLLVPG